MQLAASGEHFIFGLLVSSWARAVPGLPCLCSVTEWAGAAPSQPVCRLKKKKE